MKTMASFFVAVWLWGGYYLIQPLNFKSEFLTALSRTGFIVLWVWTMWFLVDLILKSDQNHDD